MVNQSPTTKTAADFNSKIWLSLLAKIRINKRCGHHDTLQQTREKITQKMAFS